MSTAGGGMESLIANLQAQLPSGHRIVTISFSLKHSFCYKRNSHIWIIFLNQFFQALEAGLVQEWIRTNRLLVLVENSTESALLIYIVSKNVADEFSLERTIPLDTEFKCEIGKQIV